MRRQPPHELGGRFFQPTLLDGVVPNTRMCCEETFGPVAGISTFSSEDEAIALANDTPYGLTAYVFTHDHARVWRVSEALESGMVAVNTGLLFHGGGAVRRGEGVGPRS